MSRWLDLARSSSPLEVSAKTAKTAKTPGSNPSTARFGGFDGFDTEDSEQTAPPPDRPIRDDHAAWLLTLSPADRRRWWRSVADHFNRCEDWRKAEAEAVAEFTEGGA